MGAKILIVDDEKPILDSLRRNLARRYDIVVAENPEEGLKTLRSQGPFAVIISDLSMPGMDGVRFFSKIKEKSPNSIRIMLTGHGDFDSAVAAVNDGNVFRFLVKPCPMDAIIQAIEAGLEQYRLSMIEKELLRGTLRGSIKVLVDILNLVNPDAFSRGERVKRLMMAAAKRLNLSNPLKFELVGMLSQIGMVAVPQEIVSKRFQGRELTREDAQIYRMHATVATTLLSQIPRLQDVVEIIGSQLDCFPDLDKSKMSEGAILLNMCLEYDDLDQAGVDKEQAAHTLGKRWARTAPHLFKGFEETIFREEGYIPRLLPFKYVFPGMILSQDLYDDHNKLIMAKGQEITDIARLKLSEIRESFKLPSELKVLVPIQPV